MPSIYELAPPLLAMKAARIDSAVMNHATAYKADTNFFISHPRCKTNIRPEYKEEFDLVMPVGEWLQIPRLWCLVTQIATGIHSVLPLYRGKQFWSALTDDAATALVMVEMARREGIDQEEFLAFEKRVIAQNTKSLAASQRTREIIH